MGDVLRFLTSVLRAKAVVEVGTGSGKSALSLLEGMQHEGVLTSIDIDPDVQRVARETFSNAGVSPSRTRLITGMATEVLPRLAEGSYDLVFLDSAKADYPKYLEFGARLLRPGGAIVFAGVRTGDGESVQARRDPETLMLRDLTRAIQDDEGLVQVSLPIGSGLLAVARA